MNDSAQMAANAAATLDETDWFLDPEKIADVLDFMVDQCEITTAQEAADVVREPWKWLDVYRAMRATRA